MFFKKDYFWRQCKQCWAQITWAEFLTPSILDCFIGFSVEIDLANISILTLQYFIRNDSNPSWVFFFTKHHMSSCTWKDLVSKIRGHPPVYNQIIWQVALDRERDTIWTNSSRNKFQHDRMCISVRKKKFKIFKILFLKLIMEF